MYKPTKYKVAQDTLFTVRIDRKLLSAFKVKALSNGEIPSVIVREYIKKYIGIYPYDKELEIGYQNRRKELERSN